MPVTSGKRNSASDIHNKIFIIQVEYKRHIPTCVQVSGILKLNLFQWRNILFAWCQTRCYHGVIKLEIWKCPIFHIADIISTSSSFIVVGLKENWNQTPFLWFDDNMGILMTFVIVSTRACQNRWMPGVEILFWFAGRSLIINNNYLILYRN